MPSIAPWSGKTESHERARFVWFSVWWALRVVGRVVFRVVLRVETHVLEKGARHLETHLLRDTPFLVR